ncbi:hypothetical protein F2Q69_00054809 [Brassica cretica]|uniref:Replication protein A 70 kDa DNA-binding subunit B/D first OB fold domain-containing protein n=1 Tax=Brassica cretica TaxID=69181 RepID=A0A8S9N5Z6_BRACR|nr:hypothetical protein F2Q69_00054809 [Brassica cretica]
MSIVTSDRVSLLNHVKPFKTTWKVEVKVLHSWTQHSNYTGGDSVQFILADKTGAKIHCTCKRLFLARVKKLQIGAWRFIENFAVTPDGGNFPEITNGSLDSNFLIDVIGQPIDIGDLQVVAVQTKETKKLELTLRDTDDQQIACCLWGRFAEQLYYAYKVGQVQITNAFDTSTVVINPPGFDVQDYLRLMPNNEQNNELALTTGCREVVKPKGNKRQPDKWFKLHFLIKDDTGETKVEDPEDLPNAITDLIGKTLKFGVYVGKDNVDYGSHIFNIGKTWSADEIISESDDENSEDTLTNVVSSDRSSGQVSFITIDSKDNTCLSSTPLSKRKVDNEMEDLSSTSKTQCSKIIKVEKASPLPTLDHVQVSSDSPKDSGMLGKEDLLGNMDEYDDLQFDSSSQESGETDNTDDDQPIALEPEKDNQSDRVSFLAAIFKITFYEVKTKVKPVKAKEDG